MTFTELINFLESPQSTNIFQSKLEEAGRNIDMNSENGDIWMTSVLMAYEFLK